MPRDEMREVVANGKLAKVLAAANDCGEIDAVSGKPKAMGSPDASAFGLSTNENQT